MSVHRIETTRYAPYERSNVTRHGAIRDRLIQGMNATEDGFRGVFCEATDERLPFGR